MNFSVWLQDECLCEVVSAQDTLRAEQRAFARAKYYADALNADQVCPMDLGADVVFFFQGMWKNFPRKNTKYKAINFFFSEISIFEWWFSLPLKLHSNIYCPNHIVTDVASLTQHIGKCCFNCNYSFEWWMMIVWFFFMFDLFLVCHPDNVCDFNLFLLFFRRVRISEIHGHSQPPIPDRTKRPSCWTWVAAISAL